MENGFQDDFVRSSATLKHYPALVLNADYRPLSYYPLSLWCWQDAVKATFLDRVQIVAEYDAHVHSPTFQMKIPSVVVLRDYVKPQRKVAFTRFNLFLRDEFTCQYCGAKTDLTFDHVVPPFVRRDYKLGKCRCRLFQMQPSQRRAQSAPSRLHPAPPPPAAPRPRNCATSAENSRQTTYTKAGAISCIGGRS